jgi:hypothetical protein
MPNDILEQFAKPLSDNAVLLIARHIYDGYCYGADLTMDGVVTHIDISDNPLEDTISQIDYYAWVHSHNDQEHQQRLTSIRRMLQNAT